MQCGGWISSKLHLKEGVVQDYERVFAVAINIQICYNNSVQMQTDAESRRMIVSAGGSTIHKMGMQLVSSAQRKPLKLERT